jgi:hypothetical protein
VKLPIASEHTLQKHVVQFLNTVIHPPFWWTSIDHAAKLSPRQAAARKARGVKRGIADILVMGPGPNVLWIELKRDHKSATLTPEQREFADAMLGCKAWFVLCRSVSEVAKALDFVKRGRKTA